MSVHFVPRIAGQRMGTFAITRQQEPLNVAGNATYIAEWEPIGKYSTMQVVVMHNPSDGLMTLLSKATTAIMEELSNGVRSDG